MHTRQSSLTAPHTSLSVNSIFWRVWTAASLSTNLTGKLSTHIILFGQCVCHCTSHSTKMFVTTKQLQYNYMVFKKRNVRLPSHSLALQFVSFESYSTFNYWKNYYAVQTVTLILYRIKCQSCRI